MPRLFATMWGQMPLEPELLYRTRDMTDTSAQHDLRLIRLDWPPS
jgi:hypothetical protein